MLIGGTHFNSSFNMDNERSVIFSAFGRVTLSILRNLVFMSPNLAYQRKQPTCSNLFTLLASSRIRELKIDLSKSSSRLLLSISAIALRNSMGLLLFMAVYILPMSRPLVRSNSKRN